MSKPKIKNVLVSPELVATFTGVTAGPGFILNPQRFTLRKVKGSNTKLAPGRISYDIPVWFNYDIDDCVIDYGDFTATITHIDNYPYVQFSGPARNYLPMTLIASGIMDASDGVLLMLNQADLTGKNMRALDAATHEPVAYNGTTWGTETELGVTVTESRWDTLNNFTLESASYGGDASDGAWYFKNTYTSGGTSVTKYTLDLPSGVLFPCMFRVYVEPDKFKDGMQSASLEELGLAESATEGSVVVNGVRKFVKHVTTSACHIVNSLFNFVAGRYNDVASSMECGVIGSGHRVDTSTNSVCFGHGNTLGKGVCDTVFGAGNGIRNSGTSATGVHKYNTCFGSHNTLQRCKNSACFGSRNGLITSIVPTTVCGYRLNVKKNGNDGSELGAGALLFGHYNATQDLSTNHVLEVVGNGTSSAASDARILTPDGVEKCKGWMPMTTVTAAPTTAPTVVGLWQYDSTNKCFYIATGTSAATDWKKISLASI